MRVLTRLVLCAAFTLLAADAGAAWAGTQRDLASPAGVPLNGSGYYHTIDFADISSGIWSVKLRPRPRDVS